MLNVRLTNACQELESLDLLMNLDFEKVWLLHNLNQLDNDCDIFLEADHLLVDEHIVAVRKMSEHLVNLLGLDLDHLVELGLL